MIDETTITFAGATTEDANRLADQWQAKQKGLRVVHRSLVNGGSAPTERWIVIIHFVEERAA